MKERRRPAVVVFVKDPVPGTVKTRLLTRFSPEESAGIYRAMVEDLLERLKRLRQVRLRVCFAPAGAGERMRRWLGPGVEQAPQRGRDLGGRMAAAFRSALSDGHDRVVLVGSDVPTLGAGMVANALAMLRQRDLVLGPSRDGGYYLIGLGRMHASLFAGVPWSTPRVLARTLQRARRESLRVALLPPLADVDTPPDVFRLRQALASGRMRASAAPRLARALAALSPARPPSSRRRAARSSPAAPPAPRRPARRSRSPRR